MHLDYTAQAEAPLAVCFSLVDEFLGAGVRCHLLAPSPFLPLFLSSRVLLLTHIFVARARSLSLSLALSLSLSLSLSLFLSLSPCILARVCVFLCMCVFVCMLTYGCPRNHTHARTHTHTHTHLQVRHFGFMLRGLKEVEEECVALGIPFFLLRGNAQDTIPGFVEEHKVGMVVTDYCPIRITRTWRDGVADKVKPVPVIEVDAHNIVPVWEASPKLEVGARTIRSKITKQLPTYLTPFPPVQPQKVAWTGAVSDKVDWEAALTSLKLDAAVPEVTWATPGAKAGMSNLETFLATRVGKFATKRNDPNEDACSDMSPWLHFGQVSPTP